MLTADTDTPVVTQTPVSADLLQTFQILTKLVIQTVGHHLAGLAVLDVALSVQEPIGDLVLARVSHDGFELLNLFLAELTSSLAHVNGGLLEDDVGESSANTLDGGDGEHGVALT